MLVEQCHNITVKLIAKKLADKGINIKRVEELVFTFEGEKYPSYVTLDKMKTMFSGERVWFLCPGCGYRKYKLFLQPGDARYRCRTCRNLKYQLQNVSHSDRYIVIRYRRACEKLQKTRCKEERLRKLFLDVFKWKVKYDDYCRHVFNKSEKHMAPTVKWLERMKKRREKRGQSENPRWWEDDTYSF